MIELKTPQAIEKMAVTGRFVAETLAELSGLAEVGRDVMDLELRARKLVAERGAESCYWDYAPSFGRGPFRNVICLSVNDAVLHGQPHPYVLQDGDVLSLDFAVSIDGWVADSAVTVIVGTPDERDVRLAESTRTALDAAIAAAVPGNRIGDVSAAIAAVGQGAGYRINTDFGGHGLGRTMHEDPHVPNVGRPGRGLELKPGLTLALEPWWCTGTARLRVDADGWTLRSADGSRGAHSEHTVAITEDGPRVLTALS
ncbi:methionine aminopeptidase [Kitasatospora phosalacinea]|uniref:Methionine aminopeptidase n=1 Tax=Kitasatospora phosalacinea TaxID=2065 RepID=A0A9W6Q986_9ACTN|nr:type I methionyl aminopeptidase [Kitasatospora phosalacinea]GLW70884.1 methionine aminopeptidase [Kitasatospora phosalacinea]